MKEGLTFTASGRLSNEPEKKRDGHKPMSVSYTHLKAFQAPGIVGVCDTLLNCLTFKLGEYNADIQHGPAHRGRKMCIRDRCWHR